MPEIAVENFEIGKEYTAKQLAEVWGYKSHHAIIKGIVTSRNSDIIILFVTKDKQSDAMQYIDRLEGNILYSQGQAKHGTDERILSNLKKNIDRIFLFYREKHHNPFIYYGRVYLIEAECHINKPSEFQFLIENLDQSEDDMSLLDMVLSLENSVEGRRKIVQHIRYERNPKNRLKAIKIHGRICKICGFNFDDVYGKEISVGYIEIHHISPLSQGEQVVNPAKDLMPVCANCHRMLHRKNITWKSLKSKLATNSK